MSRGLVYRWRPNIGNKGISQKPTGLDYDLWCGPAPMVPFTKNLVHYNWHWHWNYGNGDVGNQGIHQTDLCMWGLGVDYLPERITSMGGKFLWDELQGSASKYKHRSITIQKKRKSFSLKCVIGVQIWKMEQVWAIYFMVIKDIWLSKDTIHMKHI